MITFDLAKWVPKFLLADKNGYALAKAVEAAMNSMNEKIQEGVDTITAPDKMPEWRLDEVANEYNILYDPTADIEDKRSWIKNAFATYRLYGTVAGLKQFLGAKFTSVSVSEWQDVGGTPFHFSVTVDGELTEEAQEWAQKSVAAVKNARSVCDSITFSSDSVTAVCYLDAVPTGENTNDYAEFIGGSEVELPPDSGAINP